MSSQLFFCRMLRRLTFMLLMAAAVFLAAFPHASMGEGSPEMRGACQHHQAGSTEPHVLAEPPCNQAEHRMSDACAIACVGSMAPVPQAFTLLPAQLATIALWFPSALVLRGRPTVPDDRPPRSI